MTLSPFQQAVVDCEELAKAWQQVARVPEDWVQLSPGMVELYRSEAIQAGCGALVATDTGYPSYICSLGKDHTGPCIGVGHKTAHMNNRLSYRSLLSRALTVKPYEGVEST